jgi:putative ABC transport system ATP-binding protein
MTCVLRFDGVGKAYASAGQTRPVLEDVTFDVPAGRRIAVVGRSGSGKSTLLHLAAGIDVPTSGRVLVGGRDLGQLSDAERTRLRRHDIGLVFQFFHLLPHLSLRDNVLLPAWIAGTGRAADERALHLLDRVGLADRAGDPAQQLSGGEMQRVALCRALLPMPGLLLADEPTGNLDDRTGEQVMEMLLELTRDEGASLVFVTHSREFAEMADEVREIHSGRLEPAAAGA